MEEAEWCLSVLAWAEGPEGSLVAWMHLEEQLQQRKEWAQASKAAAFAAVEVALLRVQTELEAMLAEAARLEEEQHTLLGQDSSSMLAVAALVAGVAHTTGLVRGFPAMSAVPAEWTSRASQGWGMQQHIPVEFQAELVGLEPTAGQFEQQVAFVAILVQPRIAALGVVAGELPPKHTGPEG